jgi:DNA-binding IclR family transcriptional regulator
MRYSVALGAMFPILETSSGAELMARLPHPEQTALLERIVAAGEAEATREAIMQRLQSIERLGYEMRPSLAVSGCTNLSIPVRDHFGVTIAALTVPYLPQKHARFAKPVVLEAARAAAHDISRALSAPEEDSVHEAPSARAGALRPGVSSVVHKAKTWRKR